MTTSTTKMSFHVESHRVDVHGSSSLCKQAKIALDTDLAGNPDAFNPAELLLAALSACMIKDIERVVPVLKFKLSGVEVIVDGVRHRCWPCWSNRSTLPLIATSSCYGACARRRIFMHLTFCSNWWRAPPDCGFFWLPKTYNAQPLIQTRFTL
jgi:uncharacterized OsmC-like protein